MKAAAHWLESMYGLRLPGSESGEPDLAQWREVIEHRSRPGTREVAAERRAGGQDVPG